MLLTHHSLFFLLCFSDNCYLVSHEFIRASSWSASLKLARWLFTFGLLSHWMSCIYWLFTDWEGWSDDPNAWLPEEALFRQADRPTMYFRAQSVNSTLEQVARVRLHFLLLLTSFFVLFLSASGTTRW